DSASQIRLEPTHTGYALALGEVSDIKQVIVLSEMSLQINYQTGWQKTFVLIGKKYRLTKIIDAHDNTINLTYRNRKISTVTGQNGHFVNVARNEQGRIESITDNNKRQVRYKYNKKGLLSTVIDLGNNQWQYHYKGNGMLNKLTDPQGNTTAKFRYGDKNKVVSAQIRNTKHRYHYRKNQTTVTDEDNNTTIFVQNSDGITTEVTSPNGLVSIIELNKNNQIVKLGHDGLLSAEFTYDAQHRVSGLKRRKQDGSFEQLNYSYDNQGHIVGVSSNNNLTGQSVFNEKGQPIRIVTDGIERTYNYATNGDILSQTEGDINRTFEYNADGLLTTLIENGKKATFSYNKLGQMTAIFFPNDSSHHYQYDSLGFRTTTKRSDGSAIAYSYDSTGNLLGLQNTNTKGDTIQKDIVLDNNNLTKLFIVDGNQALDITYSGSGNPTTIVYNGKAVYYEYDSQNRLVKVDEGKDQILTHQYQDGEDDLRIQLDDRSAQTNISARKASRSVIGVNSLYTRSKGSGWKHVMWNEQLGQIMLPNDEGYVAADADFKSSFQRRRLYNAIATTKRIQHSFDKPSSSTFLPVEYAAVNCEPANCWLVGVTLYKPDKVEIGKPANFATSVLASFTCDPSYSFSVNGIFKETNETGNFRHYFYFGTSHTIKVTAVCQCNVRKIPFSDTISVELEPVPLERCPATDRTLYEIEADLRKMADGAKGNDWHVAAGNMEHFLTVPNADKDISSAWLQSFSAVQNSININVGRFAEQLQEQANMLQRGQTTLFSDYWDSQISGSVFTELYYASGDSTLTSTGLFTIKKHLSGYVEIDGSITNSWFDPYDFHLMIFNRWGEIIFESYDATVGWDGTYGDQGLVNDGVYIWSIDFKELSSDKRHKYNGHVTVLK
ncbi:MAG: gliding motility-associated C-terminal domain-containing protein, partial [Psychrosphaera sp.]|nr:gliding motility-associated C-terminal domain-containing protein [Psychrosphaera sp.]